MKNKQLSKIILSLIVAVCMFGFTACSDMNNDKGNGGEKPVSTAEAYTQLSNALNSTVKDAMQFSCVVKGSVDFAHYEEDGEGNQTLKRESMTIDASAKVQADNERKITADSLWIKILPSEGKGLILESYFKDGKTYSYTNLFGDNYSYEEDAEGETFDLSEIDTTELTDFIAAVKDRIPAPMATVKDNDYTITWTVNNDNLGVYYRVINEVINGNGNEETENGNGQTDGQEGNGEGQTPTGNPDENPVIGGGENLIEVGDEALNDVTGGGNGTEGNQGGNGTEGNQGGNGTEGNQGENGDEGGIEEDIIESILKTINVKEGKIQVVISNGIFKSLKVTVDATRGEEGVKGNFNCEIAYNGVTVDYPEGRLEEIKAEYEERHANN